MILQGCQTKQGFKQKSGSSVVVMIVADENRRRRYAIAGEISPATSEAALTSSLQSTPPGECSSLGPLSVSVVYLRAVQGE